MDNSLYILIILCISLITLSIIRYYFRTQSKQVIAKNTTSQQFQQYLDFRFLISFIVLIIIVFYLLWNNKR